MSTKKIEHTEQAAKNQLTKPQLMWFGQWVGIIAHIIRLPAA